MATPSTSGFAVFGQMARRGIGAPVAMLLVLAMLMLPLPPFMLDLLFTFNIALSLVILLAVVYVMRPLEFAAFPDRGAGCHPAPPGAEHRFHPRGAAARPHGSGCGGQGDRGLR